MNIILHRCLAMLDLVQLKPDFFYKNTNFFSKPLDPEILFATISKY